MKVEGIDCHIKKLRNLLVKRTSGFDGVGDISRFWRVSDESFACLFYNFESSIGSLL